MKGGHNNMPITSQQQAIGKTKHQKPSSKKYRPSFLLVFKSFVEMQMENADTRQITMEEGIFGEHYEDDIIKEQMNEFFFLQKTEIGVSIFCIYMRCSE